MRCFVLHRYLQVWGHYICWGRYHFQCTSSCQKDYVNTLGLIFMKLGGIVIQQILQQNREKTSLIPELRFAVIDMTKSL